MSINSLKVALVHDDLVQWGGAERVLEGLTKIFPNAPIFTSIVDYQNSELSRRFTGKKIYTSFLQKTLSIRNIYKTILPFYPLAFEQFDFSEYDLVLSQSTRFAKYIITKPQTRHICYCHTPPRFLWHLSKEKVNKILNPYFSYLRLIDQMFSSRVDKFLAGSKNSQERIKKIYKRDSEVLYPFIDFSRFENISPFNGGYFVVIARLNFYKRVDLVIKACQKLNLPLKVIGSGSEKNNLIRFSGKDVSKEYSTNRKYSTNIEFLEDLPDEMVVKILAGCEALIITGFEDFGITSLEAQALGKPVIAYKKGGALETVIADKTGVFFSEQKASDLIEAIERLKKLKINPNDCKQNAQSFSFDNFNKNLNNLLRLDS